MEDQKIESGFLYVAEDSFLADNITLGGKILIEKGDIIEFRHLHPIYFRTRDNPCLTCEEDHFLANTRVYGEIWDQVRFRNQNTLEQILDCKLYNQFNH